MDNDEIQEVGLGLEAELEIPHDGKATSLDTGTNATVWASDSNNTITNNIILI